MSIEHLFFEKLAELDRAPKIAVASKQEDAEIQMFSNQIDELQVNGSPTYMTGLVFAADENDSLEDLREKKQAKEPEDLVERAHPKPVYVSDALGEGGLVENINESHAKLQQMINKMPTGNLVNTYAEAVQALVRIGSELDQTNVIAAAFVDQALAEICGRGSFDKEAALPLLLIGAVLSAVGAGAWTAISGIQENLIDDANDLVSAIDGWKNKPELSGVKPLADKLYQAAIDLAATSGQFMQASSAVVAAGPGADTTTADQLDARVKSLIDLLKNTMTSIQSGLGPIPAPWAISTSGKINAVSADHAALHASLAGAVAQQAQSKSMLPGIDKADELLKAEQGKAAPGAAEPKPAAATGGQRVADVQSYLESIGFPVKKTGVADEQTKAALDAFENHINVSDFTGEKEHIGLGLSNLPGNRLSGLLETSLTSSQLRALVSLFQKPEAQVNL